MPPSDGKFLDALQAFANDLKASYGSLVAAQQEDQLKGPTGDLLSGFGTEFGLNVIPRFEAPVRGVGRPDIALDVGGALCGYVALTAPQVSVRNLRGRDREQFNKFKTLPNLVYTNGNEWILYQDGEKKQTVRLSGDVTEDGAGAVEERNAERLWPSTVRTRTPGSTSTKTSSPLTTGSSGGMRASTIRPSRSSGRR